MHKKAAAVGNRIKQIVSRSGRDAELPVTDFFLLEMADDEVLRLKGCRGIITCTPERISVTTDRFLLTVMGEGLYFMNFSDTDASVGGRIESIGFGR